jgi:hypothetical protein
MMAGSRLSAIFGAAANGNTRAVAAGVTRARLGLAARNVRPLELGGGVYRLRTAGARLSERPTAATRVTNMAENCILLIFCVIGWLRCCTSKG